MRYTNRRLLYFTLLLAMAQEVTFIIRRWKYCIPEICTCLFPKLLTDTIFNLAQKERIAVYDVMTCLVLCLLQPINRVKTSTTGFVLQFYN